MSLTLVRVAPVDALEVEGRTIFGRVVPYGEVATVSDGGPPYRESFERGVFARSISERGNKVLLRVEHERRSLPAGQAVEWEERSDGLHGAFLTADTTLGRDTLELVRSGMLDSFSVGFRPIPGGSMQRNGVTVRTEAAIREVSIVDVPAYAGASVVGVRSAVPQLSIEEARRRLLLFR